ncbi:MAG: ABC transporter permease subunit, partial [Verrucomicrobia bacterium]|nr:ABC transporter permease subunit [Verrucomicrobiota bacterium]
MKLAPLRSWFWISPDERGKPIPWQVIVLNWILAFLILALVCFYSLSQLSYNWNWGTVAGYSNFFWRGWWNTLRISALALVLSTAIGLVAALARRSGFLVLRALSRLYVELIRGTPLLVQVSFAFYVVAA